MPVLLRRGVLASLSGIAGLSGMLLRRAAKDLAMELLRGEGTASRLSFFGFFHVGRQLLLTSTSSAGSAAGHVWIYDGLDEPVSAFLLPPHMSGP